MAIKFHDDTDKDGLFDQLAKILVAQKTLTQFHGATLPAAEAAVYLRFNALTPTAALEDAIGGLPQAFRGAKQSATSPMSALRAAARNILTEMVDSDSPLPRKTFAEAIQEVRRQMIAQSETLDSSAVSALVAPAIGNVGDGVVIATATGPDGTDRQSALAETINGTVSGGSIQFQGAPAVDLLSPDWPKGSGANRSLSPATSGILANGGFDAVDPLTGGPADWTVSPGTIGTTVKMTSPEVQTIVIAGTPTAGFYTLSWADAESNVHTTAALAFNATSGQVQAALRALPGLGALEVSGTGTSPNLTHTVTFTGIGGDVAQLTSTSSLDTGTITHGTTTGGTAWVYGGGRAVEFDSDGSELTAIYQRVTLDPGAAYAVTLWAACDVIPAAGTIAVELVDGFGGAVIQDDSGASNSVTFDADDLLTTWKSLSDLTAGECVFRAPTVLPSRVYLRIRASVAVSAGTSVFLDRVGLSRMAELYSGGPLAAVFSGSTPFSSTDRWSVTVSNDRAGELHEWMMRNFDLARSGVQLPTAGTGTIPDSILT